MKSMSDVVGDTFLCDLDADMTYSIKDDEYHAGFELLKPAMGNMIAQIRLNPVGGIRLFSCFVGMLLEVGFRLGYERGFDDSAGPLAASPKYDWMKENN